MPESPSPQLTFEGFAEEPPGADWSRLLRSVDALGPEEMAARASTARRVLREQGITCHQPGHSPEFPLGVDRPWELDILPFVIPAAEWRLLEAGLTQRARLLNTLLVDLYGSQHILRDGLLPAPLIYANPNYLRPCQGVRVPEKNYLPCHAVDLARSQDGRWWVLADRTQNPAGLGFMLENRALVSRVLPEPLRELGPRPLDDALRVLREALTRISPAHHGSMGTVVVLTPGPRNEAYFEHTFLARKLCCTLAEGGDLTVRDRRVYLKTLEGLRPVDVILRRVNDAFCDPLEFRGDSLLGVPGLLDAVRSGNVAVANALGCGLVESPAFFAFLPSLCRRLLDEELLIPSVATWWCGGARELREVRARAGELTVRSAWSIAGDPERAETPEAAAALLTRLDAASHEYVGQEEVLLSRIPAFRADGRRSMEPFFFRAFLIGDGDAWHLLPGGLVRLARRETLSTGLFPLAQCSKDAWVIPDSVPPPRSKPSPPPEAARGQTPIDLPSRAADNLFWLGRYAERLEYISRITRCAMARSLETGSTARVNAISGVFWRTGLQLPGEDLEGSLDGLLRIPTRAGGVRDLVARMHLAAFAVRDRLSADTWRLLNRLPTRSENIPSAPMDALEVLDTLVLDLAAFSGLEMENMTRGHGWLFLDFGRRLERCGNLLSLIRAVVDAPENEDLLHEPMLEICDSVITFRRRYFTAIRLADALDLLLLHRDNPRSLAFQIAALERTSAVMPDEANPSGVDHIRRLITLLAASVRLAKIDDAGEGLRLGEKPIREKLDGFAGKLREISDFLTQTYFSHSVPRVN